MKFAERKQLIEALEAKRGSRVLTYFMADRETWPAGLPGFSTKLANEAQLFVIDLLREMGRIPKLDLFLYTRGGGTDAVWPLVSVLRKFSDELTVIVPFRAHSAGTLVCLGADAIIMSDIGELSPVDPTTGNQFNPKDPQNPGNTFGISVEDVVSYFELTRERAGVNSEPQRLETLKELTRDVHPLALGNVQRVYMLIRRLARELLMQHMDPREHSSRIEDIVNGLTREFFSHTHSISREEAIELLGDWVRGPSDEEGEPVLDLFDAYSETFGLMEKYSLPNVIGDQPTIDIKAAGALLESTAKSWAFVTDMKVMQQPNVPQGVQVQVQPGQPAPLIPWVGRHYEWGIKSMAWRQNEGDF